MGREEHGLGSNTTDSCFLTEFLKIFLNRYFVICCLPLGSFPPPPTPKFKWFLFYLELLTLS